DDFFGHQHTATSALPDPQPMVENLARSVMEILAGCRDLEQISRWVTDDVYRNLLQRVHISRRARAVKKQPVVLPTFGLGRTIITHPVDGVIESVVIVHGKARTRSIAIRLEGMDGRWRATAIHVL
ncbi:Rv3235 family protein, partial [Aurantimicrobium sp.]